jgi:WD40 repeat protein
MDGRLWLWPPTGGLAAAVEVPQAHNGPVSRLRALDSSSSSSSGGSGGGRSTLLASGSYDGTTKIWALSGRQAHAAACLVGHGAAVLELEQQPPLGCGGDGSGSGGALLTGAARCRCVQRRLDRTA